MEEVEAGLLEGGIRWLAETILENLDTDKLDEWIRQVGLADDAEKIRSEIERVEVVVAAVKGRAIGNRSLARSLGRLREVLYDADDAIDELDYFRLQHQVEGGVITRFEAEDTVGDEEEDEDDIPMDNTDVPAAAAAGSSSKKRSKAWEHFTPVKFTADGKASKARCKYCDKDLCCTSKNGTSALRNHLKICKKNVGASDQPPNPSSTGDGAPNGNSVAAGNSVHRKRRRTNEESTQNVPAKPWNKVDFSNRIQQITRHLQQAMNEILRLHGSDSFASSNLYHITSSDSHPITSSLVQRKMYGRAVEKENVIKLMTENDSDAVTVVPIVGIGGIGKTALAQHIYNDPVVERQFQHRIWVCVSNNFDETRLTREMLDFVCQEKHDGLYSFAKLQESLMTNIRSKRFLLVLDDVWDNMNIYPWNKLLAPLKSNNARGNVILVTTRSMSVAERIGTVELIKLGALDKKDFWTLFTECAFGEEKYKAHKCLSTIAQQIADELKGNPLAAETAGKLLCRYHTVDHWNNILKKEDWKSLQLTGGIMPSLKLSYDQLPSHLQQCFMFCSIFPSNYQFVGEELVRIWISQGFIKDTHSNNRLQEIEQDYLTDLVNLGFFELVGVKKSSLRDQTCYAVCGLMHDFAKMVSRNEYASCTTIDCLQCSKIAPTIRHLSILADSTCRRGDHNNENITRNAIPSLRNLRTLVIIGRNVLSFLQYFNDIVQKAQNLRLLQISSIYIGFDPLPCNLVNPTHIRYIKIGNAAWTQSLSKFYHIQVLDVGKTIDRAVPKGMDNLLSLRHLVAENTVYTPIASIVRMTSLQELRGFNVQIASSSDITLLQSVDQIVQLGVAQLENITTRDDACGARLRDKQNLEKLRLSWSPCSSQDKCENAREVLEGLEPHKNLKHLQISGYNGATSPSWLATSLTSLQALCLESCGQWQILPSLENLPFLRKMELRNLESLLEIPIPSLEELMLFDMPKLERCSCTSVMNLNDNLRVLMIKRCPVLKAFPLFENCQQFKIERSPWLTNLSKLTLHDCLDLSVPHPLPPSTIVSELSIKRVSTLPTMKASCSKMMSIGLPEYFDNSFDEPSDHLTTLDDKALSFNNLRFITRLVIKGCRNLTYISFEGFRQLICLKSLEICLCQNLFSSRVLLPSSSEDVADANWNALPSLESLNILQCGITGKWLSLMLQHAHSLQELSLESCEQITGLWIGEEENNQPNLMSALEASSSRYTGDAVITSARDGLLRIPLNLISSLMKISIRWGSGTTPYESIKSLARSTSLFDGGCLFFRRAIGACPNQLLSLVHNNDTDDDRVDGRWLLSMSFGEDWDVYDDSVETLLPCFIGKSVHLKEIKVEDSTGLKSLQLQFCTVLEDLIIGDCRSLTALEGLQSLCSLRRLDLYGCPGLPPFLKSLSRKVHELCPRLERLRIDERSFLTLSFCKHLTSLQRLELHDWENLGVDDWAIEVERLMSRQERALRHLTSLRQLRFECFDYLENLPAGLHTLPSLRTLEIHDCRRIKQLPEMGLPRSLEYLDVSQCSEELTNLFRTLTSKVKVKIDGKYVN